MSRQGLILTATQSANGMEPVTKILGQALSAHIVYAVVHVFSEADGL